MIDPTNLNILPVEAGNHLVKTQSKKSEKGGRENEDFFYDEVTPNGDVVCKYQVWYHSSMYPPQKTDNGWRKFNNEGGVVSEGKV